MSDTGEVTTTVIRALQYVGDIYKDKLAEDERDAIQTVQRALARISMNEHYRPEAPGIVPLSPGGPDRAT